MSNINQINELLERREVNALQFTSAGGDALWNASFYGDPNQQTDNLELIDSAAALLGRVYDSVADVQELDARALELGTSFWTAGNYLANIAIFRTYAEEQQYEAAQIQDTHQNLADLLDRINIGTEDKPTYERLMDLTYQMFLSRRSDTRHIGLPALSGSSITFLGDNGTWKASSRARYPSCSLFVTDRNGNIIPTVLKPYYSSQYSGPKLFPLANIVNFGKALTTGLKINCKRRFETDLSGSLNNRAVQAIPYAARLLLKEANGQSLPDDVVEFLDGRSVKFIEWIDNISN